ncbi:MAG: type II toxin-antitoxin system PemK/MazF family toxin [Dermatophilaceae bacterium]
MRRGELWLADLAGGPTTPSGTGPQPGHPVVVVSNDAANAAAAALRRGHVTVVPVSTGAGRGRPFQVELDPQETGLREPAKAQAEQVRSLSAARLSRRIGALSPQTMRALDDALRVHLGL